MACSDQARTAGVSYATSVAGLTFTFIKSNTKAVGILGVANVVAALLRFVVDLQNLEDCARLHQLDVGRLQEEHARLQRELEDLQRQQQAAQAHQ